MFKTHKVGGLLKWTKSSDKSCSFNNFSLGGSKQATTRKKGQRRKPAKFQVSFNSCRVKNAMRGFNQTYWCECSRTLSRNLSSFWLLKEKKWFYRVLWLISTILIVQNQIYHNFFRTYTKTEFVWVKSSKYCRYFQGQCCVHSIHKENSHPQTQWIDCQVLVDATAKCGRSYCPKLLDSSLQHRSIDCISYTVDALKT